MSNRLVTSKVIIVLIFVSVAVLFISTSCAKRSNIEGPKRTGYPEGEIQNQFVYYDGHYWIRKDSQGKRAASDYQHLNNIGTTLADHIYKIPPEDLHTAHVEVGSAVFEDVERKELIVLQKQNTVTFVRMDQEEEASFILSMAQE